MSSQGTLDPELRKNWLQKLTTNIVFKVVATLYIFVVTFWIALLPFFPNIGVSTTSTFISIAWPYNLILAVTFVIGCLLTFGLTFGSYVEGKFELQKEKLALKTEAETTLGNVRELTISVLDEQITANLQKAINDFKLPGTVRACIYIKANPSNTISVKYPLNMMNCADRDYIYEANRGIAGYVWKKNDYVFVDDLKRFTRSELYDKFGLSNQEIAMIVHTLDVSTVIYAPIRDKRGEVIGVLAVDTNTRLHEIARNKTERKEFRRNKRNEAAILASAIGRPLVAREMLSKAQTLESFKEIFSEQNNVDAS